MDKDAVISPCLQYRYSLIREWDRGGPGLLFIMLNPSTADAAIDDPTITRCINFAKREGAGYLEVVNLFAYRATDPKDMKAAPDPVGPNNNFYVTEAATEASKVICGWGNHGTHMGQDKVMLALLRELGVTPYALHINKNGSPKHPLYIKDDAPLVEMN